MSSEILDVSYVAELARLKLAPEEVERFQKQLSDVMGYIQKLQTVDVSSVQEIADAPDFKNNLRQDLLGASLTADQALLNAPQKTESLLLVPKIVE